MRWRFDEMKKGVQNVRKVDCTKGGLMRLEGPEAAEEEAAAAAAAGAAGAQTRSGDGARRARRKGGRGSSRGGHVLTEVANERMWFQGGTTDEWMDGVEGRQPSRATCHSLGRPLLASAPVPSRASISSSSAPQFKSTTSPLPPVGCLFPLPPGKPSVESDGPSQSPCPSPCPRQLFTPPASGTRRCSWLDAMGIRLCLPSGGRVSEHFMASMRGVALR